MSESRNWSALGVPPSVSEAVIAAWRQRDLAVQIAMSNHRTGNQNFALGRLWFVLSPRLRIGVYALVFGLLLAGRRPEDFIAFLAVGLFVFGLVQSIITKIGTVFDARQELLASLNFSRVLLAISALIRQALEFRFEALVLLVTVVVATRQMSPGWIAFVLDLIPLALTFALGVGLVVATIVNAVRDTSKLQPVILEFPPPGRQLRSVGA